MTSDKEGQAYIEYTARFKGGTADGKEVGLVGWPPLEDYMMPMNSDAAGRESVQRYVKNKVIPGAGDEKPVVEYRPG